MSGKDDLISHLQTGATTTCRAWSVTRKDGPILGFTDHDLDLEFEGVTFKANSGMTAGALVQSSGMSVDNTEVVGALSDASITEVDIAAGRYDGAQVTTWLVNWADVTQRSIRFRGTFGQIKRSNGAFTVELRGLTDALNRSAGRVYQANCPAVLGDGECKFDLTQPGFFVESTIKSFGTGGVYFIPSQPSFSDGWFERGRVVVLSGRAMGLNGVVKFDAENAGLRRIEMWVDFDLTPEAGDEIRIEAGCNKLADSCRTKFNNFLNFRGFPNIPGADWFASYPVSTQINNGGSRVT